MSDGETNSESDVPTGNGLSSPHPLPLLTVVITKLRIHSNCGFFLATWRVCSPLPFSNTLVCFSSKHPSRSNVSTNKLASQTIRAVALSIAQTLFIEGLLHEVPRRTHAVSPAAVVKAGASGLHALAPSPQSLNALRDAYASAIWRTLVFALVAACVALPFALGMERLNVKVVAKRRRDDVVQIG